MERLFLAATVALVLLTAGSDTAVANSKTASAISSHETPGGLKHCNSFDEFYTLWASERVPCRSARRVLRRCDRSEIVGRAWNCRVLERTWRCRVTGEDDDGVFTRCSCSAYRIRWEWCTTCIP